eukprot:COSAG03_NODE_14268_length_470_cov_1.587601_1_plen_51_part_01
MRIDIYIINLHTNIYIMQSRYSMSSTPARPFEWTAAYRQRDRETERQREAP